MIVSLRDNPVLELSDDEIISIGMSFANSEMKYEELLSIITTHEKIKGG